MKILLKILGNLSIIVGLIYSNISMASSLHFKQKNRLSVCSYAEFKPITYGKGEGFEADLLRAIAKSWKVKIQFYSEKIYEGLWRIPSRAYSICDVAIGGFTPMNYRIKEGATFSDVTATFSQSLLVRRVDFNSKKITGYESFKNSNMKIGVVPGTTGEQYAYSRGRIAGLSAVNFIKYPSESELLPALKGGKIDAIARGEIGNEYQAMLDKNYVTIAKKSFNEGFAIAIDSNNKELVQAINKTIMKIQNKPCIFQKWLRNKEIFEKQNVGV